MKTSETISKIANALLLAQINITFAEKSANNPFFKSKYADLPTVIDAVKPSLNMNNIVFIQTAAECQQGYSAVTTRLLHTSGEWIEDTAITRLVKDDPQGYGSAITYLRRYSLAAITGLYQDDDDGNHATGLNDKKPAQEKKVFITKEQIGQIQAYLLEKGITTEEACKVAKIESLAELEHGRFTGFVGWINKQTKAEV